MKKIVLMLAILSPCLCIGATYYVEPQASATLNQTDEGATAWSNATDSGSACSAETAMARAAAGDTVVFLDGQYDVVYSESPNYEVPALSPANSGSAGNYITFISETQYGANINGIGEDGAAYLSVVAGVYLQDYIVWDGFKTTAENSAQTGAILPMIRIGDADNCIVRNCEMVGVEHNWGGTKNPCGVAYNTATNVTIENNYIHDYRDVTNGTNTTGTTGYYSNNVTIKNNNITGCTTGIFCKAGVDTVSIDSNFINDNYISIIIGNQNGQSSESVIIDNNIIAGSSWLGIEVYDENPYRTRGLIVSDNTFWDNFGSDIRAGEVSSSDLPIFYNNIFVSSPSTFELSGVSDLIGECDHNQWSASFSILANAWVSGETEYTSLAAWQSSGELNGGGNPGTGSLASDPLFVAASGDRDTVEEFALQAGSPCIGAGRSGTDIGADYTTVGVDAAGLSPSAPDAPASLTAGRTP